MGNRKISPWEKIEAVESYLRGKGSRSSWSKALGVGQTSFSDWVRIYQGQGAEGLQVKQRNNKYSQELKASAVQAYLSGEGSQGEICKRYKIASRTQLQNWIRMYNGHKKHSPSDGAGSEVYMTKGRKTTYEERVEIVGFV